MDSDSLPPFVVLCEMGCGDWIGLRREAHIQRKVDAALVEAKQKLNRKDKKGACVVLLAVLSFACARFVLLFDAAQNCSLLPSLLKYSAT